MGIRKPVKKRHPPAGPGGQSSDVTMPVIAYSDPGLMELIVQAWADNAFNAGGVNVNHLGAELMHRDPQTGLPSQRARAAALAAVNEFTNMRLVSAVVISEDEHDDDFTMQDDNQVVFVLPNKSRAVVPNQVPQPPHTPPELLNTARLLMACTPNGI
jgi:hypothetical protein